MRARVNKGRAGGGTDTAFWVSCVIQLRISTGYMRTCCDMYIAFLFILQISHKYNDQRDVWPLTTCLVMAERVRPFSTLLQTPGGNRHARITVSTSIADYTSPPLRVEFFENMVEEDNDCGYRWTTPSSLVSLWLDLTAALRFNADTGVSCGVNCMTRNNKNKNKSTTDIPKAH